MTAAKYKDTNSILKEIYRQANCSSLGETSTSYLDWKDVIAIINDYPIADVAEVRHGEWIRELIRNEKGGCVGANMICSCCEQSSRHDEFMKYCPNCGAQMKGNSEV